LQLSFWVLRYRGKRASHWYPALN